MRWLNGLIPQARPAFAALWQLAQRVDPTARVTSARRSSSEQARLYRLKLAGKIKYPVAPPGKSRHEFGRAIDIIARDETLRWLGAQWERAGGRWGGRFKDEIHFEV